MGGRRAEGGGGTAPLPFLSPARLENTEASISCAAVCAEVASIRAGEGVMMMALAVLRASAMVLRVSPRLGMPLLLLLVLAVCLRKGVVVSAAPALPAATLLPPPLSPPLPLPPLVLTASLLISGATGGLLVWDRCSWAGGNERWGCCWC